MANTDPIFVVSAQAAAVTFVNADGTTAKTLLTGGTNGTKVLSIAATTDDTSANNVAIYITISGTNYLVGTKNVPTLSGTNGTVNAVDLLDSVALPWLDADGEFFIPSGVIVKVAPIAAVTAAKTLTLVCLAGDY